MLHDGAMKRPLVVALALCLGAATNARGAPLDLTACLRLAIAHNPDVKDAADSAAEKLKEAVGAPTPTATP